MASQGNTAGLWILGRRGVKFRRPVPQNHTNRKHQYVYNQSWYCAVAECSTAMGTKRYRYHSVSSPLQNPRHSCNAIIIVVQLHPEHKKWRDWIAGSYDSVIVTFKIYHVSRNTLRKHAVHSVKPLGKN